MDRDVSEQTLFKLAFEEHLSDTRMRFLNTTSTRAATSCPVASEASEVSADLSAFADKGVWTVRSTGAKIAAPLHHTRMGKVSEPKDQNDAKPQKACKLSQHR